MTAAISLIVLLVVLGSSIAVAAGMGLVGVVLNQLFSPMPLTRVTGELTWSTTTNFILTAIPRPLASDQSPAPRCAAAARRRRRTRQYPAAAADLRSEG